MDAPTKAVLEVIRAAGFDVQRSVVDGRHVVEAVARDSGETFVVRGKDLYAVAVELAQQCGIELEDG